MPCPRPSEKRYLSPMFRRAGTHFVDAATFCSRRIGIGLPSPSTPGRRLVGVERALSVRVAEHHGRRRALKRSGRRPQTPSANLMHATTPLTALADAVARFYFVMFALCRVRPLEMRHVVAANDAEPRPAQARSLHRGDHSHGFSSTRSAMISPWNLLQNATVAFSLPPSLSGALSFLGIPNGELRSR